jgi:hypothetical protein
VLTFYPPHLSSPGPVTRKMSMENTGNLMMGAKDLGSDCQSVISYVLFGLDEFLEITKCLY